MFIAMNRFKVRKDATEDFETLWASRDSHLTKVHGFVEFHMLKGPEQEDHVLYASHTVWASKDDFTPGPCRRSSAWPTPRRRAPSRSTSRTRTSRASR
jgi:heme-degrading monooxygenase HmoA